MKLKFSSIFKVIFILPLWVARDVFEVILEGVSFFLSILFSCPAGLILAASVGLVIKVYFSSELAVWVLELYWEFARLAYNAQIVAMNISMDLYYNFAVPVHNLYMDFLSLFIEALWNGLCGGVTRFSEVADCTGFNNLLLVVKFMFLLFQNQLNILLFLLELLFMSLRNYICSDSDCSNICETPSCSSWIEPRIDPFTSEIIMNPGPLGIQMKNYFEFENLELVKAFVQIVVGVVQWVVEDVLPFLVQLTAFAFDVYKLIMLHYVWLVSWVINMMSRVFAKITFVILRAFQGLLHEPDKTVVFDPKYYNGSIQEFGLKNAEAVRDAFINDYMNNITELFLTDPSLPGNKNVTNTLIDYYFGIKAFVELIFEVPFAVFLVGDKVRCLLFRFIFCIKIDFICGFLFAPPVDCFANAIMYNTSTTIGNVTTYEYFQMETKEYDVFLLMFCLGGFNNPFSPPFLHSKCGGDGDTVEGDLTDIICQSGTTTWEFDGNINCVDSPTPITVGGDLLCSGPPPDNINTTCNNPYDTSDDGSCLFCWYDDGEDLSFEAWTSDTYVVNFAPHVCGDIFRVKDPGILFLNKQTMGGVIVTVFNVINFFSAGDIWGDLAALSMFFHDLCLSLFDHECGCTDCEIDESQTLLTLLNFFLTGFPCNPVHPDPEKKCCGLSPYKSTLWFWDDVFEFFGANLFDECKVCPTPAECPVNPSCI